MTGYNPASVTIKSCKDCKWFRPGGFLNRLVNNPDCGHPQLVDIDLVTGKSGMYRCWMLRAYECGEKARYFEPK